MHFRATETSITCNRSQKEEREKNIYNPERHSSLTMMFFCGVCVCVCVNKWMQNVEDRPYSWNSCSTRYIPKYSQKKKNNIELSWFMKFVNISNKKRLYVGRWWDLRGINELVISSRSITQFLSKFQQCIKLHCWPGTLR